MITAYSRGQIGERIELLRLAGTRHGQETCDDDLSGVAAIAEGALAPAAETSRSGLSTRRSTLRVASADMSTMPLGHLPPAGLSPAGTAATSLQRGGFTPPRQ